MPCRTAFSTSGWSSSGGTAHIRGFARDVGLDLEPMAEPDLLNAEVLSRESHLAAERNPRLPAEAQAVAQEVAEQLAHAPRLVRMGLNQTGHRVQAVEEKVRIDLGPQGPKLRVALRDLRFEDAPRRRGRILRRPA